MGITYYKIRSENYLKENNELSNIDEMLSKVYESPEDAEIEEKAIHITERLSNIADNYEHIDGDGFITDDMKQPIITIPTDREQTQDVIRGSNIQQKVDSTFDSYSNSYKNVNLEEDFESFEEDLSILPQATSNTLHKNMIPIVTTVKPNNTDSINNFKPEKEKPIPVENTFMKENIDIEEDERIDIEEDERIDIEEDERIDIEEDENYIEDVSDDIYNSEEEYDVETTLNSPAKFLLLGRAFFSNLLSKDYKPNILFFGRTAEKRSLFNFSRRVSEEIEDDICEEDSSSETCLSNSELKECLSKLIPYEKDSLIKEVYKIDPSILTEAIYNLGLNSKGKFLVLDLYYIFNKQESTSLIYSIRRIDNDMEKSLNYFKIDCNSDVIENSGLPLKIVKTILKVNESSNKELELYIKKLIKNALESDRNEIFVYTTKDLEILWENISFMQGFSFDRSTNTISNRDITFKTLQTHLFGCNDLVNISANELITLLDEESFNEINVSSNGKSITEIDSMAIIIKSYYNSSENPYNDPSRLLQNLIEIFARKTSTNMSTLNSSQLTNSSKKIKVLNYLIKQSKNIVDLNDILRD